VVFARTGRFSYEGARVFSAASARQKSDGEARATLEFALGGGDSSAVDRIVMGEAAGWGTAVDDRGRSARLTARVEEPDAAPRLLLRVDGLSREAASLRRLDWEVSAYPRAERVRFHIPWLKDEVPLRVDFGGGTATLRRFQLAQDNNTLWVAVRPPAGFRVAPFDQPNAVRARAVDIYGNPVNGGGIAESRQVSAGEEPEYRFFAPGLPRVPSRLMLDVLFVSGEPRPLRLHLAAVALPPGP
jgi:hypothetical protein